MTFGIVIPARYGSERLPGKPLRDVCGKPLVVRVLENAERAGARFVIVATDDSRIAEAVTAAGGDALLTSPDHVSGTDRLAEVAAKKALAPDTVLVNLQGDEPLLEPKLVGLVARALEQNPAAGVATLATPIRHAREVFDPNVVKVVLAASGLAHYFSRAPIPWQRQAFKGEWPAAELPSGSSFLRHIGLYAYRVSTLHALSAAEPAPAERAEQLEQLRALWLGIPIHVSVVAEAPAHGVDTEQDLERVRALLERG
jgi:3-deoxy-manno-octulosonate cytidylyltransferase (CMP-KDO synthetase)